MEPSSIVCRANPTHLTGFQYTTNRFVANGIGLLLVGTCLLNIVLALLSSPPAMVGTAQDAPAVVVALIAATITANVPAGTDGPAIYATFVAAIALTTLIAGAIFLLLGQFRLGSLVRSLPYPVVVATIAAHKLHTNCKLFSALAH